MIMLSLQRLFARPAVPSAPTSSYTEVRSKVLRMAQRGLVTLHDQRGDNIMVALPDTDGATDWCVLPACGHLSRIFGKPDAEGWQCPVCEERRAQARNSDDLLNRLRFIASHDPDFIWDVPACSSNLVSKGLH
jgi:hypothetical protein